MRAVCCTQVSRGWRWLKVLVWIQEVKLLSLFSGVHTSDILTVYISAIKALRELDPSMVILQVACQPIRKYLRLDTIVFYSEIGVSVLPWRPQLSCVVLGALQDS